jgi:predicted RNase H-like nuclease (RuvC/YqgF family)
LTAERDEALHQASVARERAKKLQSELESSHKDVESTLRYRHEKETLEIEITSLRTTNNNLRTQYDALTASNKALAAEHSQLRREFEAIQHELAAVREELRSLRAEYEALQEEKMLIAQDHASLERNNDTYFKENKSLRAKITAQDQRIHDLETGIVSRDQMIDELQADLTRTAEAVGHDGQHSRLKVQVEKLKLRLQQQAIQLQEKDQLISSEQGRIRALQNENQQLLHENERLGAERQQMEDQWVTDRHKNIRLNQALMKNETQYLKSINDHNEECARREEQCKQKETDLAHKESTLSRNMDRRAAAIKTMKQLAKEITNLSVTETTKPIKMTRVVEPARSVDAKSVASEQSVKSDVMDMQEDATIQINLTQGSDFASVFTDDEIPKLRETLRMLRQQQQETVDDVAVTAETFDSDLPRLPGPSRTRPEEVMTQKQTKPPGILKRPSYVPPEEEEYTGRVSVKSGISARSERSERSHKSVNSVAGIHIARPNSRLHRRTLSDNVLEQNMTSAFFVPDITMDNETGEYQPGPSLSRGARRVLDGVCNHKSRNCTVCARISSHARSSTATKKTLLVQKPIPVTDRMDQLEGRYEDEPTMRPAMAPGHALAAVIKEIDDEIQHLQMELLHKNKLYCNLDKSVGQRERKRLLAQIQQLHRHLDAKSAIMYKLHDVLEGQKQAGQAMTEEEMEMTIASICGGNGDDITTDSKSWNGFD